MTDALREALEELYAQVKGECPSLLDEDSGGDAQLDAAIRTALQEPAPAVARERAAENALVVAMRVLRELNDAVTALATEFDKPITDENIGKWLALNDAGRRAKEVCATIPQSFDTAPQAPVEPAPVVQPEPFKVTVAVEACHACKEGAQWDVTDTRTDTSLSRTFGDEDEAEWMCEMLNDAVASGQSAAPSQLVEDARRLDWLDTQRRQLGEVMGAPPAAVWTLYGGFGASVREAIDLHRSLDKTLHRSIAKGVES